MIIIFSDKITVHLLSTMQAPRSKLDGNGEATRSKLDGNGEASRSKLDGNEDNLNEHKVLFNYTRALYDKIAGLGLVGEMRKLNGCYADIYTLLAIVSGTGDAETFDYVYSRIPTVCKESSLELRLEILQVAIIRGYTRIIEVMTADIGHRLWTPQIHRGIITALGLGNYDLLRIFKPYYESKAIAMIIYLAFNTTHPVRMKLVAEALHNPMVCIRHQLANYAYNRRYDCRLDRDNHGKRSCGCDCKCGGDCGRCGRDCNHRYWINIYKILTYLPEAAARKRWNKANHKPYDGAMTRVHLGLNKIFGSPPEIID